MKNFIFTDSNVTADINYYKEIILDSASPEILLSAAIKNLEENDLIDLIKWLRTKSKKIKYSLGVQEKYKKLEHLYYSNTLPQLDLKDEIKWAICNLVASKNLIINFIRMRSKFELEFLNGSQIKAKKILNRSLKSMGWSSWYLENIIGLTQNVGGLDSQKALVQKITIQDQRMTDLLASLISERNEDQVTFKRFYTKWEGIIDKAPIEKNQKDFFHFKILRVFHSEASYISSIIRYELQSSPIDLYESLFLLVDFLSSIKDKKSHIILKNIQKYPFLHDSRWRKLLMLEGYTTPKLSMDLTQKFSAFFQTQFCEQKKKKNKISQFDRSSSGLGLLLAGLKIYEGEESKDNSFSTKISYLINGCFKDLHPQAPSIDSINKLHLNWASHSWACSLKRVWNNFAYSNQSGAIFNLIDYSILDEGLSPLEFEFCSSLTQAQLQAFLSTSGESDAYNWILAIKDQNYTQLNQVAATYLQAIKAFNDLDYENVIVKSEIAMENLHQISQIDLRKNLILSYSFLNRKHEAINLLVESYLNDSTNIYYSPINEIFKNNSWQDMESLADNISLPIILVLHWEIFSISEFESERRFAIEEYLNHNRVEKPSELQLPKNETDQKKMICFLYKVCTPSLIDQLPIFNSSQDVVEERRKICVLLTSWDKENVSQYQQEIREITTDIVTWKAKEAVDNSRIFVDETGLKRWARKNVYEDYNRYSAYLEAGIVEKYTNWFDGNLQEFIDNPDSTLNFGAIPNEKGDDLLLAIINNIVSQFQINPDFGLDYYLSMRVRHGTFTGKLRAPFETKKLIFQKNYGEYIADYFWRNKNNISSDHFSKIKNALFDFSKTHDQIVEEFRQEFIHIRSKKKPLGVLSIDFVSLNIHVLKRLLIELNDFDEWIDRVIQACWQQIKQKLLLFKEKLLPDLKKKLLQNLVTLERVARNGGDEDSKANLLCSAISEARTSLQQTIQEIENWFELPKSAEKFVVSGEDLVEIGIETFRHIYPAFNKHVNVNIETDVAFETENLNLFCDIFNIAFDNILKRSDYNSASTVNLSISQPQNNAVKISIENSLGKETDITHLKKTVGEIQSILDSGEYGDKVAEDHGSGLMKLKVIMDKIGLEADSLQFGVNKNNYFFVTILIKVAEITVPDE